MSQNDKKAGATRKFARLVTDGPENYRAKFAGLTDEEIGAKVQQEIDEKMHRADARREAKSRERAARLDEKMARWNRADWDKPIFLRRRADGRNVLWRVFWGMFFLVAAAAVLCQTLGFFTLQLNVWWLILGIFLIAIMVQAAVNLDWFFVFVPAAAIATIVNYQTAWLNLSGQAIGGLFGVAVLAALAFAILFHRRPHFGGADRLWRKPHFECDFGGNNDSILDDDDEREIVVRANMGETVKYVDSQKLEKVWIDCRLGAVKIYFDNAKIHGNKLDVRIDCDLGGVEMYVPRNWRIASGLNNNLGGASEKGRAELTPDSPTVNLSGHANLGGVEIIYV